MSQNNEELKHHGVPGMKWGVRRARIEQRNTERAKRTIDKYDGDKIKAIKSIKRKAAVKKAAIGTVGGTTGTAAVLTGLTLSAQAAAGAAVAPAMPLILGGSAAIALTNAGRVYINKRIKKQEEYIIKSK